MHYFPWYYDWLFTAFVLLASWQTWVVLAAAAVVFLLWKKKNKKPLD